MKKIIKFEKDDCNPCVQVTNYLNEKNIVFEAINPFDKPEIAAKYRIRSVPTTLLVDAEKEVIRVIGYKPTELDLIIEAL